MLIANSAGILESGIEVHPGGKSESEISAMTISALVYQQVPDLTFIKIISAVQHPQLPRSLPLSTAGNTFLLLIFHIR